MKKVIALFLFVIGIVSCEQELILPTAYYQLQEVRKGDHYCTNYNNVYSFTGDVFVCYVRLDTSLFVHDEGGQQNKLVGFMDGKSPSSVHENSARVSYHTISYPNDSSKDTLVFKTYVYNNGTRNLDENHVLLRKSYFDVKSGVGLDSIKFVIKLMKGYYSFQVDNNPQVFVTRTSTLPTDSTKTVLTHYYGGNEVAPHNMKLWVKYGMSGTGKTYSGFTY